MSYQVLARKWRPQNFTQLVGQQHVVSVLVNAIEQQRLHHAYLFTGTRGVGKTTIARILAKSLNCEQGITATPCGKCANCVDIEQGRFVDLLEIDAASRTKVDDTREILDNVQYAPSRGRYKVYLIDEVHMLSRSSFNALLKTLEEPPEHVKFVLATTDPQKLPITVLSRCLQFHLKALTQAQIIEKLKQILSAEQVEYSDDSLLLLAKAARGSMRDCLSLTDQAIAQGKGQLSVANIQQMLGGVDRHWPYKILIALVKQDQTALLALAQEIASYAPSYQKLATDVMQLLHQIALVQLTGQPLVLAATEQQALIKLAKAFSADDVQLYYQIVLNSRKDIALCGDEQMGFEMMLLRLLSFAPVTQVSELATATSAPEIDPVTSEFTELEQLATDITTPSAEPLPVADVTERVNGLHSTPYEINQIEQDAQFDKQQQALTQEMLAIEQTAIEQGFDDSANSTSMEPIEPEPSSSPMQMSDEQRHLMSSSSEQHQAAKPMQSPVTEPIFDDNVAEILSTRNMLRSRKKQLAQEDSAKKFDDEHNVHSQAESSDPRALELSPQTEQSADNLALEQLQSAHNFTIEHIDPSQVKHASEVDHWAQLIDQMQLQGLLKQLALHAVIEPNSSENCLRLSLDIAHKHLLNDNSQLKLQNYLQQYFQHPIAVEVELTDAEQAHPTAIQQQINDKRWHYAKQLLEQDMIVQTLKQQFQATLDEQSIQPH